MLDTIHVFCEGTGLSVSVEKTKLMIMSNHKQNFTHELTYNGQPIEKVHSFKYLEIDIPSNYALGQCARNRIDVGNAKYYQFDNMCVQQTIKKWELKEIIFDTCIVQAVLYGVEVWGASTSANTWNDIEKIQKKVLCRHLGVKKTTPYSILLLETSSRPLEIKALKRMFTYIMKVKLMPADCIPNIAWTTGNALQKTKKSKFLSSSLLQDVRKWFTKQGAEAFIDMQIIKGRENAHILNFETTILNALHAGWQSAMHKSKFDYYCQKVNKVYWTQYALEKPEAQVHICTPMPYTARRAISLMCTRSHTFKIETGSSR